MATLTVWTDFSKRKNSTKRPTGGTPIDVKLKENCSIENPVFICSGLANANYCQYMNNYYYIEDIVFLTNDIVELHCSMDALATNRSAIIGANAFVKYYTHNNTEITDSRLSTKTTAEMSLTSNNFSKFFDGKSAIVSVTGNTGSGISSYSMDISDALGLATNFDTWRSTNLSMESTYMDALRQIADSSSDDVAKAQAIQHMEDWEKQKHNATDFRLLMQNIISAHYLPIQPLGGSDSILLGDFNTLKSGSKLDSNTVALHDSITLAIPWQADDWRRNAPYHQIYLFNAYTGLISISPSTIMGVDYLTVEGDLNLLSGDFILTVKAGTGLGSDEIFIGSYGCNLACPLAIGSSQIAPPMQRTSSVMQMTSGVVTGITGIATTMSGNPLGVTAISSGAGSIANAYTQLCNDLTPQPCIVGGLGGSALMSNTNAKNVYCFTVFHDTTVEPNSVSAIMGTPYNGVMAIPSSGYVQTVGADINTTAYGGEKLVINNMLDSGVYIE